MESKPDSSIPLWFLPQLQCEFLPLSPLMINCDWDVQVKETLSSHVAFGHGVYNSNRQQTRNKYMIQQIFIRKSPPTEAPCLRAVIPVPLHPQPWQPLVHFIFETFCVDGIHVFCVFSFMYTMLSASTWAVVGVSIYSIEGLKGFTLVNVLHFIY